VIAALGTGQGEWSRSLHRLIFTIFIESIYECVIIGCRISS